MPGGVTERRAAGRDLGLVGDMLVQEVFPTPTGPFISTFTDDFNDNVLDPVNWAPSSYGVISEVGGRARVGCETNYSGYNSRTGWAFDGMLIEIPTLAALAGAVTDCYTAFWAVSTTQDPGTHIGFVFNRVLNQLRMENRVGYFDPDTVTIPIDEVAQRWLWIQISGSNAVWLTSPDGITWTTRRTSAAPAWLLTTEHCKILMESRRDSGTPNYSEFDNLNLAPSGARTPVISSIDLRWAVQASVVSTADVQWAVRSSVISSADLRWAVRSAVSATIDLRWAVTSSVSSTVDLRWAVRGLVTSAADLRWAVLNSVVSGADLRWAVRSTVSAPIDLRWAVDSSLVTVTSSADFRWAVRAAVQASADLRWALRAAVVSSADLRWAQRETVASSMQALWAVREAVGSTLDLRWGVRIGTSAALDLRWAVRSLVVGDIELLWVSEAADLPTEPEVATVSVSLIDRFTVEADPEAVIYAGGTSAIHVDFLEA